MINSFFKKPSFKYKQTFTYYIPAPPSRKTGYHEKEFDTITSHILNLGYDIIDIKMQSHSHQEGGGVWIVCLIGTNNKEIAQRKLKIDYMDISNQVKQDIPLDPDIVHEI